MDTKHTAALHISQNYPYQSAFAFKIVIWTAEGVEWINRLSDKPDCLSLMP